MRRLGRLWLLQLRALLWCQHIHYLLMERRFRGRILRTSTWMRLTILCYELMNLRALLIRKVKVHPHAMRLAVPLLNILLNLSLLRGSKHREHLLVQRPKRLRVERASRRVCLAELHNDRAQLALLLIGEIDVAQKACESVPVKCRGKGLACRLVGRNALHLRLLGRRRNHPVMTAGGQQQADR